MKRLVAIFVCLLFLVPILALSQANDKQKNVDDVINSILVEKRNKYKETIKFEGNEETEFWEIFGSFEEEMKGIMSEIIPLTNELLFEYTSLTEEELETLIDKVIESQQTAIGIQGKYMKKFAKILSQDQMAIFFRDLYVE